MKISGLGTFNDYNEMTQEVIRQLENGGMVIEMSVSHYYGSDSTEYDIKFIASKQMKQKIVKNLVDEIISLFK